APPGLETLLLGLNEMKEYYLLFEYSSYIKTVSIKDLQKGWAGYSNRLSKAPPGNAFSEALYKNNIDISYNHLSAKTIEELKNVVNAKILQLSFGILNHICNSHVTFLN
ncbi:42883_t:CDS:2, partial [Gigaspora margarita]